MECKSCREVAYCSTTCSALWAPIHNEFECELHRSLRKIAEDCSVDATLLKLAYRIGIFATVESRTQLGDVQASKLPAGWKYSYASGVSADVESLVSHMEFYDGTEWAQAVEKGCVAILAIPSIPKDYVYSAKMLLGMCARINSNAHAVVPEETPKMLGLFAAASQMNHSCSPNTTFSGGLNGPTLYCRALTTIPRGTSLTISYVDLYQPRKERRQLLQNSKFFACQCERCALPLADSVDAQVEGFTCPLKGCKDGMLVAQDGLFAPTSLQTFGPGSQAAKKSGGGKSKKKPAAKATKSTETEETGEEEGVQAHKCNKCERLVATDAVDKKLAQVVLQYSSASELYVAGGAINTEKAKKEYENILSHHCAPQSSGIGISAGNGVGASGATASSLQLAEHHWIAFSTAQKLMNCCIRLGDVMGAIRALKRVANSAHRVLPANEPETASYYYALAECVVQLEQQGKLGKLGIQTYLDLKRAAVKNALEMRTLSLGAQHPLTLRCSSLLTAKPSK